MAKFLQSRAGQNSDLQMPDSNYLTVAGLRSLIAGNFYLLKLEPKPGTPLEQILPSFLLLHEKGIFVMLQCHQSGIIHGETNAEQWMCYNYLGDAKPFENPLQQNQQNIMRLSALLKLPDTRFHNLILFDNECELRRIPAPSAGQSIIWADQVEQHFAALLPTLPVQYNHTQLEALHDIFVLVTGEQ